ITPHLLHAQTHTGASVVNLAELHERHLHTDVALSTQRAIQESIRSDLKIIVMSATIDTAPIAEFLNAGTYRVETPIYPLEISYENTFDELPRNLKKAIASCKQEEQGKRSDILVFLPGQREIEDAALALAEYQSQGFQIIKFFSSAPDSEQKKAVTPQGPRKIVLATNIAETSITINGVNTVIDSGLAKVPSFSWWSGLSQLKLQKISKASAIQRAGRAGRTGPGKCIRLYSRQDFESRSGFEMPEVARSDLTMTLLELSQLELPTFKWFESPPISHMEAAERTLNFLGAIHNGKITEWGEKLIKLPLHPRLSSMVLYAEAHGATELTSLAAAALSSGGILGEDLLAGVRKLKDTRPTRAISLAQRQILQSFSAEPSKEVTDDTLAQCFLRGFADRVAQRSSQDPLTLNLCLGGSVTLRDQALASSAKYFVLPEVEEISTAKGKKTVARSVIAIEPEWLIDLGVDLLTEEKTIRWNPARKKVEEAALVKYGSLVLSESVQTPSDKKKAADLLFHAFKDQFGDSWLNELEGGEKMTSLLKRYAFLKSLNIHPKNLEIFLKNEVEFTDHLFDFMTENFKSWSFEELKSSRFIDYLIYGPLSELAQALDKHVPEFIQLGNRKVPINYSNTQPPWIESRIQDFFGLHETPKVLGSPLTLHLLAPNYRAVQVTQDLSGFWIREYPRLRIELGRRYPKHKWPENPLS
ncbi:MAG: ATP-dependent helicase C-terminal domain-containing protein, partial [Bdellovibrionales bacterium]